MKSVLIGLGSGLLFGVGLVVSGMTDPHNILGFLDFFGRWNPNLAGVMVGAIAVHLGLLQLVTRRSPFAGGIASVAPRRGIDAALVVGSGIFGVGWGLSGYCPGPAIVSLGSGGAAAVVMVAAIAAGTLLGDVVRGKEANRHAEPGFILGATGGARRE